MKKSIEVDVPVRVAYEYWTQFETFPRFMEGVEAVRQLDEKLVYWRAQIGGKIEEWDAEIVEQVPDRLISWRGTSGARLEGRVRFTPMDVDRTLVELEMRWQSRDVTARADGAEELRVQGDLERFKSFVESRHAEAGASPRR